MNDGSISWDLQQFFGAYFHQDWDLEADDWQGIVDDYVKDYRVAELLRMLAEEIDTLRQVRAEPDLEQFLVYTVGVFYLPEPPTYTEWLGQIADRLREHAAMIDGRDLPAGEMESTTRPKRSRGGNTRVPRDGRLADNWTRWTTLLGSTGVSIDDDHDGDQIVFRSSDFSYRLHLDDGSWVLDELDDRNQWRRAVGRFSTFELAEKYLIWAWASLARSAVDAPNLGSSLYAQGFAASVETKQISAGKYELNSPAGSVVLPLVKATIFSHLMDRQVKDIELEVSSGLG